MLGRPLLKIRKRSKNKAPRDTGGNRAAFVQGIIDITTLSTIRKKRLVSGHHARPKVNVRKLNH